MTKNIIALIGFALLAGCSGGGGDSAAPSSAPAPLAQPDMLTATPAGLLRGKASGQGQRLIFAQQNMHQADVSLGNGHVYYHRDGPPVVNTGFDNRDIWSVRADGSGDHAVLNTSADEVIKAVNGAGVVYRSFDGSTETWGSIRNGASLAIFPFGNVYYIVIEGERVFTGDEISIESINLDGSNLIQHIRDIIFPDYIPGLYGVVDGKLLFQQFNAASGVMQVFGVPVSGTGRTQLGDGRSYDIYRGHVGSRVVLDHCVVTSETHITQRTGPCDVVSMNTDGSGATTLTTHPANEAVQGIIGNQVIIRRNLAGNDQLIAVPVTGGAERVLITMTDSEFVELTADDFMIVRRPSGVWTLDLNGTLKQIGTVAMDSGFIFVGNALCGNRGNAVWCMPLDGSAPAVKIADTGKVVGVL